MWHKIWCILASYKKIFVFSPGNQESVPRVRLQGSKVSRESQPKQIQRCQPMWVNICGKSRLFTHVPPSVPENLQLIPKIIFSFTLPAVDHSRVKLENTENDYINASLVVMEEAQRSYILTQASPRLLDFRNDNHACRFIIWRLNGKLVLNWFNRFIFSQLPDRN